MSGAVPLRVLFAEDSPDDVALELFALRQGGFDPVCRVVQEADDLRAALIAGGWDIVIADYSMPVFSGLEALEISKSIDQDLPFILVSGTVGEDVAVHAMRAGAQDYVLKQNLTRLAPAVERELREARVRRDKRRVERAQRFLAEASAVLAESLDYHQTLIRIAHLAVPEIGDWCAVDLLDDDRRVERVAIEHRDPVLRALASDGLGGAPPALDAPRGVGAVMRTGVAEMASGPDDEALGVTAPDPVREKIVRSLGLGSWMVVPLVARGSILGALTLVTSQPDRAYGPADLEVVQELARRAAVAVDNARLYQRAQEAVRLRDDFLSIASHELKTPLTAVQLQLQGLADIVAKAPEKAGDARVPARLTRAVNATERLVQLVENLLDVSRISVGRMRLNLEVFDLDRAVRDATERLHEKARGAGSSLRVAEGAACVGTWDRMRIDQVLTNLLSNAIKYGGGNPIDVEVIRSDSRAIIRVIDRGIGFAEADRERIFGRFERAVSSRHYGGLGLGLYITSQIVGSHGGTVTANATPGGGATFTVNLPLEAVEASPTG